MLVDLKGLWRLEDNTGEYSLDMEVPGDNFSALIKEGIIKDPYWGRNETDVQWVGLRGWNISRDFKLDSMDYDSIWIDIDSLDTYSTIYINGSEVGNSKNMFIPFSRDIKEYLILGINRIEICFKSAEKEAIELRDRHPYPVPHSQFPIQSQGRNFTRKVQCHSGWDWGPCLMVSGLYNSITLRGYRRGRITDYTLSYELENRSAYITASFNYFSYYGGSGDFILSDGKSSFTFPRELIKGHNRVSLNCKLEDIELWWPNGYGEQHLYRLTLKTIDETIEKRVGFRTLEAFSIEDQRGKSLFFRVNNIDIFVRGANWIPVDGLPSLQNEKHYRSLLNSVKLGNMNMLRVWGGGQYEKDLFYDLCDEMGILIWQDFMFSCSTYPGNREFLDNVEKEVRFQVLRLRDRTSLALWCGNNEDLGAINWFPESRENRDVYVIDYDRLNEGIIGSTVKALDPKRLWWPSSPCGGEGDYSDCWHNDSRGDMHFWSVWHEGKPFSSYYDVVPRFCSEFGFQSYPSYSSVLSFTPKDQLNITSPVMEYHQRSPKGNQLIIETIARYFRFPKDFKNILYISQIQQSMAIETAIKYWRSKRPICMGILYWQLNDMWPVSSWSSIEYSGKWKPLMYTVKRVYKPLNTYSYTRRSKFYLGGNNETGSKKSFKGKLYFIDFSGKILKYWEINDTIEPYSTKCFSKLDLDSLGFKRDEGFFFSRLKVDSDLLESTTFLTEPKKCNLSNSSVDIEITKSQGVIRIRAYSRKPIFNFYIELGNLKGVLNDNNITLLGDRERVLYLTSDYDYSVEEVKNGIEIYTLNSSYQEVL